MELRCWEGLSSHRRHGARTAPAPLPPPTDQSGARKPRAETSGVLHAHEDPRMIASARQILLRRLLSGFWRRRVAPLEAPRRARSVPPARLCAASTAPSTLRKCAARRSDGPSRGHRATPVGRRRCGGGGGTRLPAPCTTRHLIVPVRAPARARGYGAGPSARCRCVAERATALKSRLLHARSWNCLRLVPGRKSRSDVDIPRPTLTATNHFGIW